MLQSIVSVFRTVLGSRSIPTCVFLLSNGCAWSSKDGTSAQPVATSSRVDAGRADATPTSDLLEASTAVLCDGSNTATFAAAKILAGQSPPFHSAWGFQYSWLVIVDGSCNFWIQGGSTGAAVNTGSLDSNTRQLLDTELSLGAWDTLNGAQEPGVVDQGIIRLLDGSGGHISCPFVGCQNSKVEEIVQFAAGLPDLLHGEGAIAVEAGILSIREVAPAGGTQPLALPIVLEEQVLEEYANASFGSRRLQTR